MADENINKEWLSFCSSCQSVLRSRCSVEEPFSLDKVIYKSTEEKEVKWPIEKYRNIVEVNNLINKKTNEHTSNNFIKRKNFSKSIINYATNNSLIKPFSYETQKINERNNNQSDSRVNKKVKYIELLNKKDAYQPHKYKSISHEIIHINSSKITHDQNTEQKVNYRTLKIKSLLQNVNENIKSINNRFFVSNLMSAIKF